MAAAAPTGTASNPAVKEWTKAKVSWGPIPAPRTHALTFALDNHVYVFGGKTKNTKDDEDVVHCLDISTCC